MRLRMPVDPQHDHIKGPSNAPLTLVEYGDFECPHCGRAYYELREVRRRMPDEVRFVFRHFPLSQIHPHAVPAAETAETAGAEGRFWQMHDMLFENQDHFEHPYLLRYAQALGLDLHEVAAALDAHTFLPRIREDFFGGVRSGVNGTPCFFINGRRHDGAWDADSLIVALQRAAREQARCEPGEGGPRSEMDDDARCARWRVRRCRLDHVEIRHGQITEHVIDPLRDRLELDCGMDTKVKWCCRTPQGSAVALACRSEEATNVRFQDG